MTYNKLNFVKITNPMKNQTIISALLILFCFLFSSYRGYSKETVTACPDSIIVIDPIPGQDPDPERPRSEGVPILASYESALSSLLLSFTRSLGEIEVDVLNSTNGGFCSYNIDTQYLYAIIPINLGSGHYILTFTLPSGQQYQGEFNKP